MKTNKVIQVIAENYEEEQYFFNKFPEVWWDNREGRIIFNVPIEKEDLVNEVIREYKELKKK